MAWYRDSFTFTLPDHTYYFFKFLISKTIPQWHIFSVQRISSLELGKEVAYSQFCRINPPTFVLVYTQSCNEEMQLKTFAP
jgi:hypothetical protein